MARRNQVRNGRGRNLSRSARSKGGRSSSRMQKRNKGRFAGMDEV